MSVERSVAVAEGGGSGRVAHGHGAGRSRAQHRHLDGDRAGLLEGQREREMLALLQRMLQPDQHDVIAAGLQLGHATGRQRYAVRSEEHTSELQSLMRISYAVFCLKKKI